MKAEAFIDVSAFICMRHFVCNSKQYSPPAPEGL